MSIGLESSVKQIVLSTSAFGPREIDQITHSIAQNYVNHRELREAVQELLQQENRSPATAARLGVCQYLLGNYSDAVTILSHADGGALTNFYLGKAHLALDKYSDALTAYESAEKAGYDSDTVSLAKAEALRYMGEGDRALEILNSLSGAVEQTAEYLYQRASTVQLLGTNPEEVVALLERAVDANSNHAGALFGLALENDRNGNDMYAKDLYERASAQFPTHVGTLLNLGPTLRGHPGLRASPAVLPADFGHLSLSRAGAIVPPRCGRLRGHVLRRRSSSPAGPLDPDTGDSGHRFRTFCPQS